MTPSALGHLPELGWGWVLRQGSEDELLARLNPRWHCLSLLGTLLAGCALPKNTLSTPRWCTRGTHWHLSTCRAAVLGTGTEHSPRAGTVSLTHPRAASTLCMAVTGDKPCSALPVGTSAPQEQPDTSFRANIKGDGLSRKSTNKLPNYFLNNSPQKVTSTKYKNSHITDNTALFCTAEGAGVILF